MKPLVKLQAGETIQAVKRAASSRSPHGRTGEPPRHAAAHYPVACWRNQLRQQELNPPLYRAEREKRRRHSQLTVPRAVALVTWDSRSYRRRPSIPLQVL